jgi:hypothetical protein
MSLSEPWEHNSPNMNHRAMLIQRRTVSCVGCIICPGPKGESNDIFKAGCFRDRINTVNYMRNANERTVKVTLSPVTQSSSLSTNSLTNQEHQEWKLWTFCLLNRKH